MAIFLPSPLPTKTNISSSSSFLNLLSNKRSFPLAAALSSSTSYNPQLNTQYLENEFTSPGVTFSSIGDSCVVGMALENGTAAKLMLPSGLITSFKAQMWHGATMELLHTSVSEMEDGGALIQGGLSLALGCENYDDDGFSWWPSSWSICGVNGNPQESVQVELMSKNEQGNAEIKHIITLGQDVLTSQVSVFNSSKSSLQLKGSILCHLAMSTPEAAYALGLEGSEFFIRPPFSSNYSLIPPNFSKTTGEDSNKLLAFSRLFSRWDSRRQNVFEDDVASLEREAKEELEGEEDDNYKHLTDKLSRIYTSAPRSLTIMDRGRRNSVVLRRNGFKEMYMLSPGSEHEYYGKYSYICIGHSALLEPIILDSESEWRGELHLCNPNT